MHVLDYAKKTMEATDVDYMINAQVGIIGLETSLGKSAFKLFKTWADQTNQTSGGECLFTSRGVIVAGDSNNIARQP